MPKSNLPQQITWDQYTADGKTSIFNYTFLILIDEDIAVYVTNPGDLANPEKDLQVLNQDYTVQNAGTMTGGTITFTKNKSEGICIGSLAKPCHKKNKRNKTNIRGKRYRILKHILTYSTNFTIQRHLSFFAL